MTLLRMSEAVIACNACGFAGLVGQRYREWARYQMPAILGGSGLADYDRVCLFWHAGVSKFPCFWDTLLVVSLENISH
jgi:hypothetical protein